MKFIITRKFYQEYLGTCEVDCDSFEDALDFAVHVQTEDFDLKVTPNFISDETTIKEKETP